MKNPLTLATLLLLMMSCENASLLQSSEVTSRLETSETTIEQRKDIRRGRLTNVINSTLEPPSNQVECETAPTTAIAALRGPASETNECNHEQFQNKKVLYIGDSHSYLRSQNGERMGNIIINQLESCGASQVHYHGVCGSRPRSWMAGSTPRSSCGVSTIDSNGFETSNSGTTGNIQELQEEQSPQVIVINLGDNMFSWKREGGKSVAHIPSIQRVINEVRDLVDSIEDSVKCQWIGPVYHSTGSTYRKSNESVDQLYSAITRGLGDRCQLIDSRPYFQSTRPNDGLHLTSGESTVWGEKISESLRNIQ